MSAQHLHYQFKIEKRAAADTLEATITREQRHETSTINSDFTHQHVWL